jgi:hypothetical protein
MEIMEVDAVMNMPIPQSYQQTQDTPSVPSEIVNIQGIF